MHLGVNLRKAFLSGVMEPDDEAEELGERKYHRVDTLVHDFCKLFGRTGVPEYASGVVSFPYFLELETSTRVIPNHFSKSLHITASELNQSWCVCSTCGFMKPDKMSLSGIVWLPGYGPLKIHL